MASRPSTSVTGEEPMARAALAVWVASLDPEPGRLGPGQEPGREGGRRTLRVTAVPRAPGHRQGYSQAPSRSQRGGQEAARREGQREKANAAPDPEAGVLARGPTPPPRWRARRRPNTWQPAPLGPACPSASGSRKSLLPSGPVPPPPSGRAGSRCRDSWRPVQTPACFAHSPPSPAPLTSSPAPRGAPGQAGRCSCPRHPAAGRRGLERRFPLPHR